MRERVLCSWAWRGDELQSLSISPENKGTLEMTSQSKNDSGSTYGCIYMCVCFIYVCMCLDAHGSDPSITIPRIVYT